MSFLKILVKYFLMSQITIQGKFLINTWLIFK